MVGILLEKCVGNSKQLDVTAKYRKALHCALLSDQRIVCPEFSLWCQNNEAIGIGAAASEVVAPGICKCKKY